MNAAVGDSAVILALGGAVVGCVTLVIGLLLMRRWKSADLAGEAA